MSVLAVIPARYTSTRFPGKPLVLIAGKPMIQHVYERVSCVSRIDSVLVATDDERIRAVVADFGGEAVLTSPDHQTGTDRIVEAIEGRDAEWVLNVQGDEPAIDGNDLSRLIETAQATPDTQAATLVFRLSDPAKIADPNIVKAVVAPGGHALYFSRSPIPFPRKVSEVSPAIWRHLGVYLFRREFLVRFHAWPQTPLEQTEQLEQLRILEHGEKLLCVEAQHEGVGVDVPEDLPNAEEFLRVRD